MQAVRLKRRYPRDPVAVRAPEFEQPSGLLFAERRVDFGVRVFAEHVSDAREHRRQLIAGNRGRQRTDQSDSPSSASELSAMSALNAGVDV